MILTRSSEQRSTDVTSSLTHEHEALGVGDDLGGIKSLLEVIDELLLVTTEWLLLRTGDDLGSTDTLLLDRRQATGEDGFTDEGD